MLAFAAIMSSIMQMGPSGPKAESRSSPHIPRLGLILHAPGIPRASRDGGKGRLPECEDHAPGGGDRGYPSARVRRLKCAVTTGMVMIIERRKLHTAPP